MAPYRVVILLLYIALCDGSGGGVTEEGLSYAESGPVALLPGPSLVGLQLAAESVVLGPDPVPA